MAAGDEITWADLSAISDLTVTRPLVRLVQTVAQSIPDNTATAITFTTEDIDTNNFHDTGSNTSRITPTIAGYYSFRGVYFSGVPTTLVSIDASIRKNGTTSFAPGPRGNAGAIAQSQSTFAYIAMDGITDYCELMALQDSSGAVNTNVSSRFSSVFECIFERSL